MPASDVGVAERDLTRHVQKPPAARRLELAPQVAGQQGHLDVARPRGNRDGRCARRPASPTARARSTGRPPAPSRPSPAAPATTRPKGRAGRHRPQCSDGGAARQPIIGSGRRRWGSVEPQGRGTTLGRGDERDGCDDPADAPVAAARRPRTRPARRRRPAWRRRAGRRAPAPQSRRAGGPRRRLPCPGHRALRAAGGRPVVARVERASRLHAYLRVRRPGPGGVVHGLARLGHRPPAQPVLLGRGQRPRRRQPAVEHVGDPGRRGPGAGHLGLRSDRLHQRRPHAGAGAERVGLLRRHPPPRHLEGGRRRGGAGLRLLGRLGGLARVRPRVGHHAGGPAAPLHAPCTKS